MMHRRLRRVALQAERHTKTLPRRMRCQGSTRGGKRIPLGERNEKKKKKLIEQAETQSEEKSQKRPKLIVSGFRGRRLKDSVKQCHYDLNTFQDFTHTHKKKESYMTWKTSSSFLVINFVFQPLKTTKGINNLVSQQ